MRDKSALQREVAIHRLVENRIPVPSHLYADNLCSIYEYPYAILEWIEGKLMREIILTKNETAICACAYDAGKYLNELRNIKFMHRRFFSESSLSDSSLEDTLKMRPFDKEEEYLTKVESRYCFISCRHSKKLALFLRWQLIGFL